MHAKGKASALRSRGMASPPAASCRPRARLPRLAWLDLASSPCRPGRDPRPRPLRPGGDRARPRPPALRTSPPRPLTTKKKKRKPAKRTSSNSNSAKTKTNPKFCEAEEDDSERPTRRRECLLTHHRGQGRLRALARPACACMVRYAMSSPQPRSSLDYERAQGAEDSLSLGDRRSGSSAAEAACGSARTWPRRRSRRSATASDDHRDPATSPPLRATASRYFEAGSSPRRTSDGQTSGSSRTSPAPRNAPLRPQPASSPASHSAASEACAGSIWWPTGDSW